MPYVNGYNLRGYSPDPDNLHVFATLDEAREDHKDTLERWSDECYDIGGMTASEEREMESISRELAADARMVHEWITDQGGSTSTRGSDGNEYVFWTVPKTLDELKADGWSADDLYHAGITDSNNDPVDDPIYKD